METTTDALTIMNVPVGLQINKKLLRKKRKRASVTIVLMVKEKIIVFHA